MYKNNGFNATILNLNKEIHEINRIKHVLTVDNCLTSFQELIDSGIFTKNDVKKIVICNHFDYDLGNIIKWDLLTSNDNSLEKYDNSGNYVKIVSNIREIFKPFIFNKDFVNSKLKEDKSFKLYINKEIINNLRNLLLSKDLMATYQYLILDDKITKKDEKNTKIKI